MTKPTTTDLQDVEEHERRLTLLADELDKRALSLLAECGSASNARLVTSSARGLCEAAVKARRAASELASSGAAASATTRLGRLACGAATAKCSGVLLPTQTLRAFTSAP